jgi:hypothetical protein
MKDSPVQHEPMPHKDRVKAFNEGKERSENPHLEDTWQYEEWDFGWKTEEECSVE